jgi:hypothetical protein
MGVKRALTVGRVFIGGWEMKFDIYIYIYITFFGIFGARTIKKATFKLQKLANVMLTVHHGPIKMRHTTTDRLYQQLSAAQAVGTTLFCPTSHVTTSRRYHRPLEPALRSRKMGPCINILLESLNQIFHFCSSMIPMWLILLIYICWWPLRI